MSEANSKIIYKSYSIRLKIARGILLFWFFIYLTFLSYNVILHNLLPAYQTGSFSSLHTLIFTIHILCSTISWIYLLFGWIIMFNKNLLKTVSNITMFIPAIISPLFIVGIVYNSIIEHGGSFLLGITKILKDQNDILLFIALHLGIIWLFIGVIRTNSWIRYAIKAEQEKESLALFGTSEKDTNFE